MAVSGYHSPHLGVILMAPITVLLWWLFFRYIYIFINFRSLERVVITAHIKKDKGVCLQDDKRIYVDCIDANFGVFFPFLSSRSDRALVKARLRNKAEIEVSKFGGVYIYQKGKFSLMPILLPVFTTGLLISDIFQIFNE
jgi:hypothetical protein